MYSKPLLQVCFVASIYSAAANRQSITADVVNEVATYADAEESSGGVPNPKAPQSPTCDPSVVIPPTESLKSHFDGYRRQMSLMNRTDGHSLPQTCSKRDVCLLMRQLDMDFYKRARAGTLTDMDFDTPPEISWLQPHTACTTSAARP